jgi:hypothetical protein
LDAGSDRIIELHGGSLSVRSTPGAGSTFTVSVPVAAGEAEPRGAAGERAEMEKVGAEP